MLPGLILPGDRNPPGQCLSDPNYRGGSFGDATFQTLFTASVARPFQRAPVGNHVATYIVSWRNGATPGLLSGVSYGGTAWTIIDQLSLANSMGIAFTQRQLTATEISTLQFAGTGSLTFTSGVQGLATGIGIIDNLLTPTHFAYNLARTPTPAAFIENTFAHIPQGAYIFQFCAMEINGEALDMSASLPMVNRVPSGSPTPVRSWFIAECPKYRLGWGNTLRANKINTPRNMAMASLVFS